MSNTNKQVLWGIDLGGTKVEGVVLDASTSFEIIARRRVPTLAKEGYETVLSQIALLISELEMESGYQCTALGIGTPGKWDKSSQTLQNSNTTCLNGSPFLIDLQDKLQIPIKIENDANCFALSEARYLMNEKGVEGEVILGLILGTGVGGGVIANGSLISGKHGIGGEWGHIFLDESGGECYCGKVGCVETIISGPALERYYTSITGEKLALKEIVQRHRNGVDLAASQTIDRLCHFFGKGIATVMNFMDPAAIVIGGGVGNIDEIYTDGVAAILPHLFNYENNCQFLKPKFGDSSGVFGAALL